MFYRAVLLLLIFWANTYTTYAQGNEILFEDFIIQHEGLDNVAGELVPINIDEIEKKIRFFIEEKFPKIVENTDNILWDAYMTFTSHADKQHRHRFIAQVKVRGQFELKFIEIEYFPFSGKVEAYVSWSPEEQDFVFDEKFLALEESKADLVELKVANQNEKPCVALNSPVKDVIVEISKKRLGMTAVAQDGKILGIITDGDLRRMLAKTNDISALNASNIMTPNPKVIHAQTLAVEAMKKMESHEISQLLVIDNDSYAGVVHIHDLIREGIL